MVIYMSEGWKKGEEECGMRKIKGEIKGVNISLPEQAGRSGEEGVPCVWQRLISI